jgi:hypothetical protein
MILEYNKFYITKNGQLIYTSHKTHARSKYECWAGLCVGDRGFLESHKNCWFDNGCFVNMDDSCWTCSLLYVCFDKTHPMDIEREATAEDVHKITKGPIDVSPSIWREILIIKLEIQWSNCHPGGGAMER